MIRFEQGQQRFNFCVVGIAIHNGQVLLHRTPDETFWTFPGGRAELGETTAQTLQREMREKLAADIEIIRLLWVVENFFDLAGLPLLPSFLQTALQQLPETMQLRVHYGT